MQLRFDAPISYEDAELIAHNLYRFAKATAWWFGDFLIYVEKAFPETWSQLIPDDINKESLRNYKWVAERFPPGARNLDLPWSHYQICAGIEDAGARMQMLQDAASERLNCYQLRKRVRVSKGIPKANVIVCPKCGWAWDK